MIEILSFTLIDLVFNDSVVARPVLVSNLITSVSVTVPIVRVNVLVGVPGNRGNDNTSPLT